MKLSVAHLKRDSSLRQISGAKSLHSIKKKGNETTSTVEEADSTQQFMTMEMLADKQSKDAATSHLR